MVDIISKKPNPKFLKDKKGKKIYKYEDRVAKMKALERLDLDDFEDVKEMGMFIDHHNNMIREKKIKEGDEDISEISKFLARMNTQKHFIIGEKKV